MIIDDNLVSIESGSLTSSSGITGQAIALTSFLNPGRQNPIPVSCLILEAGVGGTSITITIKQSESLYGNFSDCASVTIPCEQLKKGARIGFRFLPQGVKKPWIKFAVSPTGTFTSGKIFCALTREDPLPYTAGMYIDKGNILG